SCSLQAKIRIAPSTLWLGCAIDPAKLECVYGEGSQLLLYQRSISRRRQGRSSDREAGNEAGGFMPGARLRQVRDTGAARLPPIFEPIPRYSRRDRGPRPST